MSKSFLFQRQGEARVMPKYSDYYALMKELRLPCAYVDWNLLRLNAIETLSRANGLPIRIASKSLRSVTIIKKILAEFDGFSGILAYSAQEAAYLSEQGLDDIVIAYPTVEQKDILLVVPHVKSQRRICFMVDTIDHARMLNAIAADANIIFSIALDVDLSLDFPGLYFGVYRSSLKTINDLMALIDGIAQCTSLNLIGLMGYEAQFSLPDRHPQKRALSKSVSALKMLAEKSVRDRRQAYVAFLKNNDFNLQFVNAGGTGTLEFTVKDSCVTELTAGSAFFGPRSFDHFLQFRLHPAAGFALPVTRLPKPGYVTCHGGGYIASGAIDDGKLPQPFLPAGLTLLKHEGAGEVQTPLKLPRKLSLSIGDPVIFRHAKAGELAEHFNAFHVVRDGKVIAEAKTYRGDGHAFL